jgi:2-polyprenyl-3-methyl-5-hydroxy-6-metoxy-1,4-benzoquinol methylase
MAEGEKIMPHDLCPASRAWMLDNWFRKLIFNPERVFRPYIRQGMTILDLGSGPGFISRRIARMVRPGGQVIAADIQDEMLSILTRKAMEEGVADVIRVHQTRPETIGLSMPGKIDGIIAFHMVHEVDDINNLFRECHELLKPDGFLFFAEPTGHISQKKFSDELQSARTACFVEGEHPVLRMSRTVVLKKR